LFHVFRYLSTMKGKEISTIVEGLIRVLSEVKRKPKKKRRKKRPSSSLFYMDYAVSGDSGGEGG